MRLIIISESGSDGYGIDDGASAFDLAVKLGCKKSAIAAEINGIKSDLSTKLKENDSVLFINYSDCDGLSILRHSTAHVLAKALLEIDETSKLAIGPAISDGFYYDVLSTRIFSTDDLEMIEGKMRHVIDSKLKFEKSMMKKSDAIKLFEAMGQDFKVELIDGIADEFVGIYRLGDFVDLCRGPHVPSTSYISVDALKLTSVAGAYWRGDSSKAVLQRIYGTAFPTRREMESHFVFLSDAKARDHRKIGQELEIFHIDDHAPGNIFWLKNGTILFNLVKNKVAAIAEKYGYFFVQTPQLLDKSLWEISGHWEKFRENMYVVNDDCDNTTMAIKPMNCPGHIIVYKNGPVKSYRDLPIRMAEFGLCHRNEPSGSLHGLMRIRAFMQDDGHVFCSSDQIGTETQNFCDALQELYNVFGFTDIVVKFSDRPEKRAGSDEVWDIAEKSLKDAADAAGLDYTVNRGEGAFYGPKLEFVLKDSLGREWQCGTLQVDFVLPTRFNTYYIDRNGKKQTPVMLHRAIVGSLERFIGILIEHYAGKFPFWLAPVQIVIASVTDESAEYAKDVFTRLRDHGFRVILDIENEKITYKIREHFVQKVPFIVVVGKNEAQNETVSVRALGSDDTKEVSVLDMFSYFSVM
ncbi:MAG: threonine--tRNA ligase [Holosporales bacterium]|jgi:threonyl-tRNA synthetase|nr:threonine--tRNA ligase [Holosporales bacterium]